MHPTVQAVTARIRLKSTETRSEYLLRLDAMHRRPSGMERMGCANVAHAFAATPADERFKVVQHRAPNVGIVSAYNDMLSAHAPYQSYPNILKDEAKKCAANAQVAGGVPAMCDGVTQGLPGMELSLFSRDVIAMATAVALSHDVFDAALMLGVCDKIVPGLLIGALQFGHLPTVFVPAGPMTTGLSNSAKAKVRERAAQGQADRPELMASEQAAYHGLGTCTFYGTANSNQMLLEAMGLHVPGSAFVQPAGADAGQLREQLTREAMRTVLRAPPIGRVVDERCIVNAMVALLATGGSTNHLIHWVAVARAAGIVIDWTDFDELSAVTPLIARIYPNGDADVNAFQAAGGPGFVIRELLDAGLMHGDVLTVGGGMRAYCSIPVGTASQLQWQPAPLEPADTGVLRRISSPLGPFSKQGGLRVLNGNLGRSVIKISAVDPSCWVLEAPARVFDSQESLHEAFASGELNRDVVCVVRFQGPRANGMPELHKLTPPLAVLQGKGFKVALVTDGRMSGASGKVPAAIHVSPEACNGGPLAKVRDGDVIRLDAERGMLSVLLSEADWATRPCVPMPKALVAGNGQGFGRDLFAGMRRGALPSEQGACTWL